MRVNPRSVTRSRFESNHTAIYMGLLSTLSGSATTLSFFTRVIAQTAGVIRARRINAPTNREIREDNRQVQACASHQFVSILNGNHTLQIAYF
jgi:hypothetical protein